MPSSTYILGGYQTDFSKAWSRNGQDISDMTREGTLGTLEASRIEAAIPQLVRLTPKGIRTHLGLNKPIYKQTAAYGHFGRTATGDAFPWERTDLTDKLKAALAS